RAAALLVACLVLVVTFVLLRRGALASRIVVELREDVRQDGHEPTTLTVTACGEPTLTTVRVEYRDGTENLCPAAGAMPALSALRALTIHLPALSARELKIWAHRITPAGESEALAALVEVCCGEEARRYDLALSRGQVMLSLAGEPCQLTIAP